MKSRSRSLGLETVSWRVLERLGLVSVSRKSGKVSVSSRTENRICLGLISVWDPKVSFFKLIFNSRSSRNSGVSRIVLRGVRFLAPKIWLYLWKSSPSKCISILNSTPLNVPLLPQPPLLCHPRRFTSPNSAPSLEELLQIFFVSEGGGSSEPNEALWIRPCRSCWEATVHVHSTECS